MNIRKEPFKKDLPVALDDDEVRQRTLQHFELQTDVKKLEQQKKDMSKDITETIKEKKKAADKLMKVVIDKIEYRPVDVWEVADWDTKRVLTMRASSQKGAPDVVVDARGMSLEEQQTEIPGTETKSPKKPVVEKEPMFGIMLEDAGENPTKVVKELKIRMGGSLGQAKSLVADCPKVILESLSRETVEANLRALEKTGAKVSLVIPKELANKALPAVVEPVVRKPDDKDESAPAGGLDAKVAKAASPEDIAALNKKFRKNSGIDDRKASAAPERTPRSRKSR